MPRKIERRMEGTELNEKRSFAIVLGQVLQELRIIKKLSLLDVAVAARISEGTICRYEYGNRIDVALDKMKLSDIESIAKHLRIPDLFTAYKLSFVLGVTLDQLMARCFEVIEEAKRQSKENNA